MCSPLAEDHATLKRSADGWVPLQPWDHLWYSTSVSELCTQWGRNKVFLSSTSFLLCSCGPSRHVPNTKAIPNGQSTERGQRFSHRKHMRAVFPVFERFLEIGSESRLSFFSQEQIVFWAVGALDNVFSYFILTPYYTLLSGWLENNIRNNMLLSSSYE